MTILKMILIWIPIAIWIRMLGMREDDERDDDEEDDGRMMLGRLR